MSAQSICTRQGRCLHLTAFPPPPVTPILPIITKGFKHLLSSPPHLTPQSCLVHHSASNKEQGRYLTQRDQLVIVYLTWATTPLASHLNVSPASATSSFLTFPLVEILTHGTCAHPGFDLPYLVAMLASHCEHLIPQPSSSMSYRSSILTQHTGYSQCICYYLSVLNLAYEEVLATQNERIQTA